MIGTLMRRQLHHLRWILWGLALGLVGFEVFILHLGAAFEAGPGIQQFLEMLPEMIHRLVKSQIHAASFPAFVAFGFMHPTVLASCLASVVLVGTTPAGERESGLLELLMARPLRRTTYLHAHVVGIVLLCVALPTCVLLGAALGLALVEVPGELPWWRYIPCALGLGALMLAVGGFSLALAATARRRGTALARIIALLLVAYVVDTAAQLSTLLGPLRWVAPFQYFHPIQAALEPPVAWWEPAVLVVAALLATHLAYRRFQQRDL